MSAIATVYAEAQMPVREQSGGRTRRRRGLPAPVGARRAWFAFALVAVLGTIAAALLPSPWSIVCGSLAALGAMGAFAAFVAITVLEDAEDAGARRSADSGAGVERRRVRRVRARGHGRRRP